MIATTYTVAFQGLEARRIEVQCAVSPGLPAFTIVGLADKAVSEARERVRAAFSAMALALPARRITVNLAPADQVKSGAHFDLPIALALMAAIEAIPREAVSEIIAIGELRLDGALAAVPGALPAAMAAAEDGRTLICPQSCGSEAAWVEAARVLAAPDLLSVSQHLNGQRRIEPATTRITPERSNHKCISDIRGQNLAKRALEIASAGRHHLLMIGPPGAGKSMLAARLPGILPRMTAQEALETSMVHSLSNTLGQSGMISTRPFREPHHSASMAAIIGGGRNAGPGEISLAHNGVLFLDELPEFSQNVLETLRQPLETNSVVVARANAHVRYPCRILLIAAANPCKCGYAGDPERACNRAPGCSADYLGRLSGPLLDRFDMQLAVSPVPFETLNAAPSGETSDDMRARIEAARALQAARFEGLPNVVTNADLEGDALATHAALDSDGEALLKQAATRYGLSARGVHRVLRVARTIADLEGEAHILKRHIAESCAYRFSAGKHL